MILRKPLLQGRTRPYKFDCAAQFQRADLSCKWGSQKLLPAGSSRYWMTGVRLRSLGTLSGLFAAACNSLQVMDWACGSA